jgi:hypothetical protein
MSVTTEKSSVTTAVRPFTVPVTPEAELEALRARLAATHWPDRELVFTRHPDTTRHIGPR